MNRCGPTRKKPTRCTEERRSRNAHTRKHSRGTDESAASAWEREKISVAAVLFKLEQQQILFRRILGTSELCILQKCRLMLSNRRRHAFAYKNTKLDFQL